MKRVLIAAFATIGLMNCAAAQVWVGAGYPVAVPYVNPYAPPVFAPAPVAQQYVVPVQPYSVPAPQVVYGAPPPVYVQPQPVYVQPQPVYVQPQPVYVQPQPVYTQPNYAGVIAATALIGGAAAIIATSGNRYYGGNYRPYYNNGYRGNNWNHGGYYRR